ncbi:MAG: 16S rRNA (uracil(1498)-N(3))-methyltransferase [Myxococcales bacterium]|nr:16S rRNA (uracil(1498)-N(3))-methyltransferase [Myxococcales bacterium]
MSRNELGLRRLVVAGTDLERGAVELSRAQLHHVKVVLRLRDGAGLELLDGEGGRALGRLEDEIVRITSPVERRARPRPWFWVLQCAGKGDKVERVLQQAAELGVARFVVVESARTLHRGGDRLDRYRAIAEDACRVSGSGFLMHVEGPLELDAARGLPPDSALKLLLHVQGGLHMTDVPANPPADVAVLVGPEGGFEASEVERSQEEGYLPLRLGDGVLRTETAAIAAIAALRFGRWCAS